MKNDQQPENEAWRRRREEELRARQPEPWYARQTREDRVGDGVASMQPPVAPPPSALPASGTAASPAPVPPLRSAPPPSAAPPPEAFRAKPGEPRHSTRPPEQAPPRSGGTIGRTSAIVAGLLFAVAAGWQARDMLAPVPAPRLAPVVAVPRAPAPPPVVVQQCDAPGVINGLRASIAADVRRGGADPMWSARVAGETEVAVAPQVTTVGSDGTRFCGATLTLTPPPTATGSRPLVASVTYSTGAVDDRRGPVFGLQGMVSSVAALIALGQPPKAAVPPAVPQAPVSPSGTQSPTKPVTAPKREQPVDKSPRTKSVAMPKREPVPPSASDVSEGAKSVEHAPTTAPASASLPTAAPPPVAARNSCADAVSRAEAMICASPPLRHLDRQLNTALDRVEVSDDAKLIDKVNSGQRRFLSRRDRCTDDDCIAKRVTDRLDDIARIEARAVERQDDAARNRVRVPERRVLPQCKGFEVYRPTRPCRVGRQ